MRMGRSFQLEGDLVEMKRAVDEDDIPSLNKIAELVNTISFKIKQIPKPVLMEGRWSGRWCCSKYGSSS